MIDNSDVMIDLKNKLLKILPFINDKSDIVLLDFPMHYNIGDLLIFLGEIYFFNEHKMNFKTIQGTYGFSIDFLKKIITKNTTILCHGGGNFGDLYDIHQKLREDVVMNFPENRVIVLPQTAYFSNIDNQNQSQKIFSQHKNLIMFARDKETLNLFNQFTDNAFLMPDMAHALYGSLPKNQQKKEETLFFFRKDREKVDSQYEVDCSYDWEDLITQNDRRYLSFVTKLARLNQKFFHSKALDRIIYNLWIKKCQKMVGKFSILFSSYEKVLTSRLHGHILSCLLDTSSGIIDNSYGKNTNYYNLWTAESTITGINDEK